MHCMSTKFGVDSSSCFHFRVWTQTNKHTVTASTDHCIHRSATGGGSVGNDEVSKWNDRYLPVK